MRGKIRQIKYKKQLIALGLDIICSDYLIEWEKRKTLLSFREKIKAKKNIYI